MSLNQKYTWHDFLKEHPEFKEKGTKRTSSEGKKAFESAFKTHAKAYLEKLDKRYDAQIARSRKERTERTEKARTAAKAKDFSRARMAQRKVGRADAAVAQMERQKKRAQAARKAL